MKFLKYILSFLISILIFQISISFHGAISFITYYTVVPILLLVFSLILNKNVILGILTFFILQVINIFAPLLIDNSLYVLNSPDGKLALFWHALALILCIIYGVIIRKNFNLKKYNNE